MNVSIIMKTLLMVTKSRMTTITKFTCSSCQYGCEFNKFAVYNDAHEDLWKNIQSCNESVVAINCPRCNNGLLQCCLCEKNIDRYNHTLSHKQRRTPFGYMKIHTSKKHRPTLTDIPNGVWEDTCVFNTEICTGGEGMEAMLRELEFDDYGTNHDFEVTEEGVEIELGVNLLNVFDHVDSMISNVGTCQSGSIVSSDDDEELVRGVLENDIHLFGHDGEERKEIVLNSEQIQEDVAAMEFVNQLLGLQMDQNEELETLEMAVETNAACQRTLEKQEEDMYCYDDFKFFDTREQKDKLIDKRLLGEKLSQNQLYFWQMHRQLLKDDNDHTGGFAGLAYRANVQNREDPSHLTDYNEASIMNSLMNLLLNSTGKMKKEFIEYQRAVFELLGVNKNNNGVKTRIPTTMEETRSILLEGTNSILKNFPVPKVFDIKGHACVSVIEVVRLMAGHGADFNFINNGSPEHRNREGLNGTPAGDAILEEMEEAMKDANVDTDTRKKTKKGWVLVWSDGFLRCFIKQKDNAVWIITITVCPPENKKSSGMYTHVLAMGPGGADHTDVIDFYLDELNKLKEGFDCYFGLTNRIERLALAIIVWSADRPERQAIQGTRKEGTYGKVSGYAVNPSNEMLPACLACYQRLVNEMMSVNPMAENDVTPCSQCCNWSFEPFSSGMHLNDDVGKDYPQSTNDDVDDTGVSNVTEQEPEGREAGVKKLGAVKLTTDWMSNVAKYAYTKVQRGHWKKATCNEYLRTCNIKGSIVDSIANKGETHRRNGTFDPSSVEYKTWSLISCFGDFKFPDVPLHGLGHGMIPDVMFIVQQIFSHHNKFTPFVRYANTILDDISSFRLDYCKIKNLPKSAWVGENVMGYMRIMSYLVGSFLLNNQLSIDVEETKDTVSNLKCMLNAFQALVSILMTVKPVLKKSIENHMKLFLSSAHYLHDKYGSLNTKTKQAEGDTDGRKGKNTKTKSKTFIDLLSIEQLRIVLEEMGIGTEGAKGVLRTKLSNVGVKRLREVLRTLELPTQGKKEELQRMLVVKILEIEIVFENDGSNVQIIGLNQETECILNNEGVQAKREKRVWDRGNWLSYAANIADQIEYLGYLQLIW